MTLFPLLLALLFLQICTAKELPGEVWMDSKQPANNDVLAFSAELSRDYPVAPGNVIVFDRTITNVGGMYFNTSGQFGCTDGLWMFTWNLAKATSSVIGMRGIGSLRVTGTDRKYGPKTSYYSTLYNGVSEMTTIVECTTSPPTVITIAAKPWTGDISSTSVFVRDITSFSGFRLQADIAFTAELSQDHYALPGARVRFDNALVNVGNHYEPLHSYFRCPDLGVYVFTVSTHTPDPETPWSVSRLMMDGVMVMEGPMTYMATDDYDSGSASITAVLRCSPNSSVYVESQAAHDFFYNSYGAELTSFTGFKLSDILTGSVAFFAVLTQNFTANAPVPFDKVITNIGGAYDRNNSRFVCPDDEYYMFTWTAIIEYDGMYVDLHMDGLLVKQLYTSPQNSSASTGTSGSCTQSVIMRCQAYSMFQVIKANGSRILLGNYTSFSGYKLPG